VSGCFDASGEVEDAIVRSSVLVETKDGPETGVVRRPTFGKRGKRRI
jgi:hypothetical protein